MDLQNIPKVPVSREDKKKSYYHFYERELKAIPEEKTKILENVYGQPGKAMEIEDRNLIFSKDALPDDPGGIRSLDGGSYVISNLTRFQGSNGEMLQWYFAWHPLDSLRYSIWDPYDHYGLTISEEDRARILDPHTSLSEKCRNVTHYVNESLLPGTEPGLGTISFKDPVEMGYDSSLINSDACSFIVTANVEVATPEGMPNFPVVMLHMAQDRPYGCILKSRFWMGYQIENGCGILKASPEMVEMIKPVFWDLQQHYFFEFTNLAEILPVLYKEEGNSLVFSKND